MIVSRLYPLRILRKMRRTLPIIRDPSPNMTPTILATHVTKVLL